MLSTNIAPLMAEATLRERGNKLTADSVKKLTLIATGGDEEAAEDAWLEAAEREVRGTGE